MSNYYTQLGVEKTPAVLCCWIKMFKICKPNSHPFSTSLLILCLTGGPDPKRSERVNCFSFQEFCKPFLKHRHCYLIKDKSTGLTPSLVTHLVLKLGGWQQTGLAREPSGSALRPGHISLLPIPPGNWRSSSEPLKWEHWLQDPRLSES